MTQHQFINPRQIGYQSKRMGRRRHRRYGATVRALLIKSILAWLILIQALGLMGALLAVLISTIH